MYRTYIWFSSWLLVLAEEIILPIKSRISASIFTFYLLYWFESVSNCVLIIYFDLYFVKIIC